MLQFASEDRGLTHARVVQDGKMIKSVIMPGNKQAIVVYRLPDGRVYCSDANSTAFEFPLSNAKVITEGACSTGRRLTVT